jgi:hypothetical protein
MISIYFFRPSIRFDLLFGWMIGLVPPMKNIVPFTYLFYFEYVEEFDMSVYITKVHEPNRTSRDVHAHPLNRSPPLSPHLSFSPYIYIYIYIYEKSILHALIVISTCVSHDAECI